MRSAQDRQASPILLNQQPIAAVAFGKWIVCDTYTFSACWGATNTKLCSSDKPLFAACTFPRLILGSNASASVKAGVAGTDAFH